MHAFQAAANACLGLLLGWAAARGDSGTSVEAPLYVVSGYGVKGLVLWISPDKGVSLDDQGRVASLDDEAGNFTLKPKWTNGGPLLIKDALHGRPVFRFDGQHSLFSPDGFGGDLNGAMTFIIVGKSVDPGASQRYAIYLGGNSTPHANRAFLHYQDHDFFDGQFVGFFGKAAVKNSFYVAAASVDATLEKATFYRNGGKTTVSGTDPANGNAEFADLSDGVTFGAATDPVCGWLGDIAEVLVYDRQLTPAEEKAIWTALAAKYDLHDIALTGKQEEK